MESPASSTAAIPPQPSDSPAEAPRRRSGGQKRKPSNLSSSSAPSKRLMKERNALNIHSSPLHNGPVTRARQSPNKLPALCPESASAVEGAVSCPAANGVIPIVVDDDEMEEVVFEQEPVVDLEFNAVRLRGNDVHVVPVSAGWFSWKDIHQIEKHTLASFFSGKFESRTPEIYMEIRNSIMKKFHSDPRTQLELEDLSDISIGDTEARQEVMEVLAHWGLINFHPFPPSNPEVSNSGCGENKTQSSLVEKLYKFENVLPCFRILAKKVDVSVPTEMANVLPYSATAENLLGPMGPSVEYHCNSCSADCSRRRYHCQKQADFDLCTECYDSGKFGSGMTPADFILMEPAEVPGISGGSWTDQETLLLLEALELFGENWNEIAEHVATKTKAQCILHFLQMPIEDPFLDGNEDAGDKIQEPVEPGSASKETNASCAQEKKEADSVDGADQPNSSVADVSTKGDTNEHEFSYENGASFPLDALKAAFQAVGLIPEQGLPSFAEAGNPVMALAAFLTRLVESDAIKTSFRSSLKAMSEDSPCIQLATRHCFILENPPNDMKDLLGSESAVTDVGIMAAPKEENHQPTSNENNELKASDDTDGPNSSNGSDELKPSNGSDHPKPSNDSNELKPSDGSDEPKPSDGSNELKTSNDVDELKSSNDNDELKLSNDSVYTKTGSDELNPINGSNEPNDCPNKNEEDAVPDENERKLHVSLQECLQKMPAAKESGDLDSSLQEAPISTKEPDDLTLQGPTASPSDIEDTNESASPMIVTSTNSKESGDPTFQEDNVNLLEVTGEDKPDSVTKLNKLATVDEIEVISDTPMIVDTKPTSAPCDEPESQQNLGTTLDSIVTADGEDRKVSPVNNEENQTPAETNGDHKINRLKRAAATALSTAAVKAKLLASQEENHTQQLVSLVIEKQLHKLDAKLSLFTEIESVVMRMREHIEKARQRLVHERALIVAARYGLPPPPPPTRANPMSLHTGKLATGHAFNDSKPPTMASLKMSPMRRP